MSSQPSTPPPPKVDDAPPPSERATIPLRFKLVVMAGLLAMVPPFVVGYRLIDVNANTVEELSRGLQLAVVNDVANAIEQVFTDAQDSLHAVGRVLADAELPEDQVLASAFALVESAELLDHAAIYARDGSLIDVIREEDAQAIAPPETLPTAIREQAEAQNVATGDAEAERGGPPRVLVVVPLRAGGEVTGFTASLLSLGPIQHRVEQLAMANFEDMPDSIYVVDQRLRIVAHPRRERAEQLQSAADEGILRDSQELLAGTLARSGEFTASDGTPMLASATALERRPWVVVAQVPQSHAYASLDRMRRVVTETVVVAIVLALLAGLLFARQISAPLRRLTSFAHALAHRRFDARLEVNTRDELALLATAMTRAATDLEASEESLRTELAIRSDLGRYLPGELVDQIVRREQTMELGGERRQITVLFADVVAFTPLTEKRAPEEVVTILNELFTILTGIVFRHGGTVDKFVGDCVMAIWGAPKPQEDHAARAVAAAEDMFRWLETGNATWQERFDVTIRLAVGIHSGEAVVGNVGSETRMEYTAIGDAVNVAARLESIARPQQILITEATRDLAGSDFEYVDAGSHKLAGKEEPVQLFEVRLEV